MVVRIREPNVGNSLLLPYDSAPTTGEAVSVGGEPSDQGRG